MKREWNKFQRAISWAALLGISTAAYSQTTPQMEQILNRLDQLEKDNQALLEEVRALRQEVSGLRTPPAEPGAAQTETAERQAIDQNRIDELAQTKVEASEKFPIRITGMALFNASVNGRFNGGAENPLVASPTPGEMTGDGTLRQSTLGLLFNGPETFWNGKISGSVYLDFFGGSTSSLDHLVRLRTAAIDIDWKNTSVMFGQDKPIISPRNPDSFAQVGYSPLSGAGNLWLWQPQARVEQRFSLGENSGLRLQAGVIVTSSLDYPSTLYVYMENSQQQEYSRPGAEGRLELWHRWSANDRFEIAGGYHYNQNRVIETLVPSEIYSFDWFLRPLPKLEFSGMVFHGQNVEPLGALPQGYIVQIYDGTGVNAVHSTGGWAQIRVPITERLAWDLYGGQQDDRNSDLAYGYIGKNQGYFSNLMYRIAPNVIVSLEGGQVRTTYLGLGNRLNDHYDLGVAYLF
ncbi:MAG: hypothetical protein ACLPWF_09780 [Bryobacteraceae bacterium]|jgi:hypothetical protein